MNVESGLKSVPVSRTYLLCVALLLAAGLWSVREHLSVAVLPYDDAFITFRYVENVAHGAGLTYNPPIRVWGFTSPLYVLWLTVLRLVFSAIDLPTVAVRANVVFVLAAGAGAFLLVRRYTADIWLACLAGCVLLVHPSLLSISAGGMESLLFLSLLLFALLALTTDRAALAGALIGLSFLARPEGVLLLPLALFRYRSNLRQLLRMLMGAGVVAGLWLAFAAGYFNSIVPLPIIAKNRPLYPLPPGHALGVIFGYMGPVFAGQLAGPSFARDLVSAAVIVAATAACVVYPPLRARQAWMPGVFAILAIALYGYGNPMFFEWYWPTLLGPVLIAVIVGGAAVWHLLAARRASPLIKMRLHASPKSSVLARSPKSSAVYRGALRIGYWAVPMWIVVLTIATYRDNAGGHSKSIRFVDQDGTRLRILTYRTIGEQLTALTSGSGSIATPEVGALGYYFAGRMIDAAGLVSPEAIRFLPVPEDQRMGPAAGAISVELVRSTYPDWVVTMPIFAQNSLLQSDWFRKYYKLEASVPLPKICFDSLNVLVFKRRPH